jgi:3-phosphoshikimate 1-carboxyvinyltransferase
MALPGSKSISNRVLLLAALSEGSTRIDGLLDSDDTRVMLAALRKLGLQIDQAGENQVVVHGKGSFPQLQADLFLGNAGTAFRPLTAALAMAGGHYRLHGVPRMHERPVGDLVTALQAVGAQIRYEGQTGYPPLQISPGQLHVDGPIPIQGNVSSQFLTAFLMMAPILAARAGTRRHLASPGRADLQAVYRHYAAIDGAFWRHRTAGRLAALYHCCR